MIDEAALWDRAVDLLERHRAVYAPAGLLPILPIGEGSGGAYDGAQTPLRVDLAGTSSGSVDIVKKPAEFFRSPARFSYYATERKEKLMVRTMTRPDPATEARERARMARRAEIIEGHREREGKMVDYRTHSRKVMESVQRQVQDVLNDPYRAQNPRAQHEEAMRIARQGQQEHATAVQEAMSAYDAEMERLEKIANPPPQRGQRSTAELLERQQLLDRLERRWQRSGSGILDEYQQALKQGDQLKAELMEDYASEYIEDSDTKTQFSDAVSEQKRSRLPASAQTALEQLEGMTKKEYSEKAGWVYQRGLMSDFVDGVRQGQPIVTRDDIEGQRAAGLSQVGGGQRG
jgi:hypothetical protein